MNILKENLINNNNDFCKYNIYLGFYNNNKKCFKHYISKNNFNNIKNKFKKYNYNTKNIVEYRFLNKIKIHNLKTNNINYLSDNISKYFYLKNNNSSKEELNYGYLLVKEATITQINCIDFPNIETEHYNKKIIKYKIPFNSNDIFVNFVQVNNQYYTIHLTINFDKKIINDIILNLNSILNIIYNTNFNLIKT